MKKYSLLYPKYWNILFFVFITSCSIFHNQFSTHSKKEQRFQEALQHEWDKTHDPKLGFVPSNRLQSAVEYYNEVNLSNLKTKTSPAFADIEWKERGPNNVSPCRDQSCI